MKRFILLLLIPLFACSHEHSRADHTHDPVEYPTAQLIWDDPGGAFSVGVRRWAERLAKTAGAESQQHNFLHESKTLHDYDGLQHYLDVVRWLPPSLQGLIYYRVWKVLGLTSLGVTQVVHQMRESTLVILIHFVQMLRLIPS